MKKRTVVIFIVVMLLIGLVTMYRTYAIDEESINLEPSTADYNLIYNMRENSNREITLNPSEEKFVDISLTNTYSTKVKYGVYYSLKNDANNINATISETSQNKIQDILNPSEEKTITIKIKNNGEKNANVVVGALIGFENGKIEDLAKHGEVLIK